MSKKKEIVVFSAEDCEMMKEAIDFFHAEVFEFDVSCPGRLRSAVGSARSKLINTKLVDGANDELPLTVKEVEAVAFAIRYIAEGLSSNELTSDELPDNLCSYNSLMRLLLTLESFLKSD